MEAEDQSGLSLLAWDTLLDLGLVQIGKEIEFAENFEYIWINRNPNWFNECINRTPKTDNCLERFNGTLKQHQTIYEKERHGRIQSYVAGNYWWLLNHSYFRKFLIQMKFYPIKNRNIYQKTNILIFLKLYLKIQNFSKQQSIERHFRENNIWMRNFRKYGRL